MYTENRNQNHDRKKRKAAKPSYLKAVQIRKVKTIDRSKTY